MRWWISALLLAAVAFIVASFARAREFGLWFPAGASTLAPRIDGLFALILALIAIAFAITHAFLVFSVVRFHAGQPGRARATHGHTLFELAWTLLPGAVLAWLAWTQLALWRDVRGAARAPQGAYSLQAPLAEVEATQFDWRFRYPGPDGRIGGLDDLERAFELVVPVDTPIVLRLSSRDVIHSFFVPAFRLKQDVVPGRALPLAFTATAVGEYDLVCAELCGWGHYKMAGRVRVVTREEFERFRVESTAEWNAILEPER